MRPRSGAGGAVVLAFIGVILIGGSNAVAIRLGNVELAPFWGASLRLALAAALLLVVMGARRSPLPRGRAAVGVLLYGLTAFAGSYAALYWGLVEAPAPTAMIVIATVPLMTLVIAVAAGQEQLSGRGVVGALIALAGVAIIVGDQLSAAVPMPSLVALFVGAAFIAIYSVLVKHFPRVDPVTANGLGMAVGAPVLAALSLVAGEPWLLPREPATWASVVYLALVGSIALFILVLYVLGRWSASASSYSTLAMPLVTIVLAAVMLGESVGLQFLVGASVALAGVYVGVFSRQRAATTPPASEQPDVTAPGSPQPVPVGAEAEPDPSPRIG